MDFRGAQANAVKGYGDNGIGIGVAESATESIGRIGKAERAHADADMLANRAVDLLHEAQETLKYIDERLNRAASEQHQLTAQRERVMDFIARLETKGSDR